MYLRNIFNRTFTIVLIKLVIILSVLISGCSSLDSTDISTENPNSSLSTPLFAATDGAFKGENILTADLSVSGTANRPIAVMVENSFAARPQSGLILADVVYEVVDEYGITRFVAIFSSNEAPVVGPVRSARPYYAESTACENECVLTLNLDKAQSAAFKILSRRISFDFLVATINCFNGCSLIRQR